MTTQSVWDEVRALVLGYGTECAAGPVTVSGWYPTPNGHWVYLYWEGANLRSGPVVADLDAYRRLYNRLMDTMES